MTGEMVIFFSAPTFDVESQTSRVHLLALRCVIHPVFTGNTPHGMTDKLSILCSLFLSEDKDRDLFATGWQSGAFQSAAAPGQGHSDDPGAGCDMCVW